MKTIDIHAHMVPRRLWQVLAAKQDWYGYRDHDGGRVIGNGQVTTFTSDKVRFTPEERLKDMDAQDIDVQVVSIHTPFSGYHLEAAQGTALAREVNDEIVEMTRAHPKRFAGLANLPMQDVKAAIAELERSMQLGLKGAELDTEVNGTQWDDPRFMPFFKEAERMGAVLFFHPQPQNNFLRSRIDRYGLVNSVGVVLDDAIVTAILICSGVLEACPDLKICIAHGGGPACYGMGRLDRAWHGRPEARQTPKPPSAYQKKLYYDTVVGSEEALRFLLDRVGADRVVLGSDWPFVPFKPSPGGWVQEMQSLSQEEKDKILWKNLESLLGL